MIMDKLIAKILDLNAQDIKSVLSLLAGGATIPFIARYRKEATGGLNEVDIEKINNERKKLIELEHRKKTIFERLDELNIEDLSLRQKIKSCFDKNKLEDLYLPFKPKRKTKASAARELGLEPLAKIISEQKETNLNKAAQRFRNEQLTVQEALQGARHILAEWINEDDYARSQIRRQYQETAILSSRVIKKKKAEATKYSDYFEFDQLLKRMPSHRLLAVFRAEKEGLLRVKIQINNTEALNKLEHLFITSSGDCAEQIKLSIEDALKRLLSPSLETELRSSAKEKADADAIEIFTKNLSQLLLAPPLGSKRVLALDPGFRSGCKLVCLDEQGSLIQHCTIFPHPPQNEKTEARHQVLHLLQKHQIEAIAIGNGTAGRETEVFIKELLPPSSTVEVYLVNEAGASIYSASETGRNEFPDLDLTVRGSISIGRRLMDPLAELVKIDPKSIGVGQYQHDVAQDKLKSSLNNTISFAVNKVGINLNTASEHLLQHVAGIGPKTAKEIVQFRNNNGPFKNRKSLLDVKGLGAKAFEQAAGFLRVRFGDNPLDATGVHPERYNIVKNMTKQSRLKLEDLIGNQEVLESIPLQRFVSKEVGLPTLVDILDELKKPGLDPRGAAKSTQFDERIKSIDDLHPDMIITGRITNLTKFGAFVDIGIKENGLIHKSQIADRFIADPSEVLRIDQEVQVKVLEIDLERKRIQLSMKET